MKYALNDVESITGVDIQSFISAVKGRRFNKDQCGIWTEKLDRTHSAQRQILVAMVYGIYCDSNTSEQSRLNSIDICSSLSEGLTVSMQSELVNHHYEYGAKGYEDKHTASSQFFEKLGLIKILSTADKHSLFYKAVERLRNVHNEMNNFYREPVFAERLLELTSQAAVPETIQEQYVQVIACCK